ncbi:MAG: hypothetical protein FWF59_00190 [Turicibacter sp.]|nr:hypothetical protein [Turicibacter sp.]
MDLDSKRRLRQRFVASLSATTLLSVQLLTPISLIIAETVDSDPPTYTDYYPQPAYLDYVTYEEEAADYEYPATESSDDAEDIPINEEEIAEVPEEEEEEDFQEEMLEESDYLETGDEGSAFESLVGNPAFQVDFIEAGMGFSQLEGTQRLYQDTNDLGGLLGEGLSGIALNFDEAAQNSYLVASDEAEPGTQIILHVAHEDFPEDGFRTYEITVREAGVLELGVGQEFQVREVVGIMPLAASTINNVNSWQALYDAITTINNNTDLTATHG